MKETHIPTPPANSDPDEIDLIALAKTLWLGRRIVYRSIMICGIIGLIVALTSPKEFVATTILVPSGSDGGSKLGGLGGLAAMAGINLNTNTGSDLAPALYPQIIASLPYQLELMNEPLNFNDCKEPVSFYTYYSEPQKENFIIKYTIGLPKLIMSIPSAIQIAIHGNEQEKVGLTDQMQPIELTNRQRDVRVALSGLISLSVNQKEGTLTLTTTMPEAKTAAQLCQHALELLQQYITEFKIRKARVNLDFIQQRYDETALKFDSAQEKLASFRDRNKNVSMATAKTEEEHLTSQYNLIYGVYTELAKQLEQAKIQVKQDTPVFTIIEPVSVPTKRSKPNRPMILMIWLVLGGVTGTSVVFGKGFIEPIKTKWKGDA